jgi:hypothetical protein
VKNSNQPAVPIWTVSIVLNDGRLLRFARYSAEHLKARCVTVKPEAGRFFRFLEIADNVRTN